MTDNTATVRATVIIRNPIPFADYNSFVDSMKSDLETLASLPPMEPRSSKMGELSSHELPLQEGDVVDRYIRVDNAYDGTVREYLVYDAGFIREEGGPVSHYDQTPMRNYTPQSVSRL